MVQSKRVTGMRLTGVVLLALAAGLAQSGAPAGVPASPEAVAPGAAPRMSSARDWIQRMNGALQTRNYDGVFRQQYGKRSEVFRIVHQMKDGQMTERVISQDGSGYEQRRKGTMWAQYLPEKRLVDMATRNRSFGFIPMLNGIDREAEKHYSFIDAGAGRLVGRDVQVIHVDPRDELRYGYRFWLDRESALPLKLQRTTLDGKVVMEIAFITAPTLPETISDDQLKVGVDITGYRFVSRDRRTPMVNAELKRNYAPQPSLLPPGYRTRNFGAPGQLPVPGPRARFIVHDGISWCDVFLEPAAKGAKASSSFINGPMSTYQLVRDDVQVVVVGEMPEATARAIAEAVRSE